MIYIFCYGSALVLILSGLSKLISHSNTKQFFLKYIAINDISITFMALLFPLLEIGIGIGLFIYAHLILYISALSLISIFIIINSYALINKVEEDCKCFGNLIPTKTGLGGLIQSLGMFFSIVPLLYFDIAKMNIIDFDNVFYLVPVLLWFITLIIIRRNVEVV
ncbi:MauE/DoxX family redox-associated membrane protein [Lysinibacillus fusiformis]|uniref:MauE/DoxX family redox-associated membrane protein n=1 Tax=Lysinibacillus fusiformis TaxID=28031 RepID=UPI00119E47F8|nr:MauE/DoxX family redox-associated membrane protein [Lysinibacillus fusiformis]